MTASGILQFLDSVWEAEHGWVSLPYKERSGAWKEARPFEWPKDRRAIREHIEARLDERSDLYFCPLILDEPRRKASSIGQTHWCWSDLDAADPREIKPRPTIAWQTSEGRYQALWRLSRDVPGVEASELSKRIAYHVGADPSGWDLTQVLRPPGSFNFKYSKPFQVDTLWIHKKEYKPRDLDSRLPEVDGGVFDRATTPTLPNTTAARIMRKYKNRIPSRALKLLRVPEDKVTSGPGGDRSERFWELQCLLAEAGLTAGEIVILAQSSSFNKYKGRNDEITRLWYEATKAINQAPAVEADGEEEVDQRPRFVGFRELMSSPMSKPKWLIEDLWARESQGMIAGEPKTFKSVTTTEFAIGIAAGVDVFDQFKVAESGPVLMINEENSTWILQDRIAKIMTTRGLMPKPPRLNGSEIILDFPKDLPIRFLNNYGFDLTDLADREFLEEEIREYKPIVIFFDPLYLMLGDADETSAKDLRPVLRWLMSIKVKYKTAIIIVHHHRKADAERGGQRMSGSHILHAWTESALYLTMQDPDTNTITVEREQRSFPRRTPLLISFKMEDPGSMVYETVLNEMDDREQQASILISHLASSGQATLQEIMELLNLRRRSVDRLISSLGDRLVLIKGKGTKQVYGLKK